MYTNNQKQLSEVSKKCYQKFGKFQTRTPVLESLFKKVPGLKSVNLFKKTPTQVLSG